MHPAPPLFSRRKFWASRFGVAPFLPRCLVLRWTRWAGSPVTSSSSPATPTWITPVSAWRSSAGLLEAQGIPGGDHRAARLDVGGTVPARWASLEPVFRGRGGQYGLDGQPLHLRTGACATTTPTRRTTRGASARIGRLSCTASAAGRRIPMRRSVIGGIEASACAGSPTTTTGRTRCGARSWWTPKRICLLYGNAERAIVEVAHRAAAGEHPKTMRDLRGAAFMVKGLPEGWLEIDSTELDRPGSVEAHPDPYAVTPMPPHPKPLSQGERDLPACSPRPAGEGLGVRRLPSTVARHATTAPKL
jgi:hypothetical protein